MSTPDMTDVTRLVNTDTPPAVDLARLRLLDAMERAASDLDSDGSATYRGIVVAALAAVEAYPGYALVRLPEPDSVGATVVTWATSQGWHCYAEQHDGRPVVFLDGIESTVDHGREHAAQVLAACDHAEYLADEHNTAHQDREEGDQRGE